MIPNFLIIGAMKSATSSLADLFTQHPQIFFSTPKEPEFFYNEAMYSRGWEWYESLFERADGKLAVGEGSTSYTKHLLNPNCAERVAKHLPDCRLIYIVRHPLERIESHWLHMVRENPEIPPLPQAVRQFPHLVDTSLYWKQINAYRTFYPDDRIQVLFFEDFVDDPDAVLQKCFDFLQVDSTFKTSDPERPRHVSRGARRNLPVVSLLKKVPGLAAVKQRMPGIAAQVLERFRKPINAVPGWDTRTYRSVARQLREDSQQFLNFYGKQSDHWDL